MQRIACLLIGITAACGGGTESGPANLTGVTPAAKSVGARTFAGPDGNMMNVLGWKLEFFEQGEGADCLSTETNVVASIGIYTSQLDDGVKPQALLQVGDIPIVAESPSRTAVDYEQLQRFGIRSAKLPEGTLVVHQPRSFYQLYRLKIQLSLAVFTARGKAQIAVESQRLLEQAPAVREHTPVAVE
jgi:hypothetical protein